MFSRGNNAQSEVFIAKYYMKKIRAWRNKKKKNLVRLLYKTTREKCSSNDCEKETHVERGEGGGDGGNVTAYIKTLHDILYLLWI